MVEEDSRKDEKDRRISAGSAARARLKNKHRGLSFAISSALTVCLLVIIPIRQVDGQSGMEAYERGALSQVEAYLSRGAADSVEAEFLRAALTADAENAVEN